MASGLELASPSKPLDLCFVKSRACAKCLIFATLGRKMADMLAGRRRSHSATGISPRMILGMILGGLAASASEQEAALVEVSWLSRSRL
jgi:hypothetical protein